MLSRHFWDFINIILFFNISTAFKVQTYIEKKTNIWKHMHEPKVMDSDMCSCHVMMCHGCSDPEHQCKNIHRMLTLRTKLLPRKMRERESSEKEREPRERERETEKERILSSQRQDLVFPKRGSCLMCWRRGRDHLSGSEQRNVVPRKHDCRRNHKGYIYMYHWSRLLLSAAQTSPLHVHARPGIEIDLVHVPGSCSWSVAIEASRHFGSNLGCVRMPMEPP